MTKVSKRMAATLLALATLAVVAAAPTVSRAQGAGVDPEAVKLLRRMTDYLGSLQQFSVHTQNTLEDVLDFGAQGRFRRLGERDRQPAEQAARRAQGRSDRPDLLLRRQDTDVVQPVRQGLCDGACTWDDRGRCSTSRASRSGSPSRSPTWSTATPSRC